jgi:hypothetical protein
MVLSWQLQMPHLIPSYEEATGIRNKYLLVDLGLQTPEE